MFWTKNDNEQPLMVSVLAPLSAIEGSVERTRRDLHILTGIVSCLNLIEQRLVEIRDQRKESNHEEKSGH